MILKSIISFQKNKISVWNFIALASSSLIPLFAIYTSNKDILLIINNIAISQIFTVILDGNLIIKTQLLFAKWDKKVSFLAKTFFKNLSSFYLIIILLSFLEINSISFSFISIAVAKHIENFCRNSLPQINKYKCFSYQTNMVVSVRNLIFSIAIIFNFPLNLNYFIAILYLIEIMILNILFSKINILKIIPNKKIIFKVVNYYLFGYAKRFINKNSTKINILESLYVNVDRIIVTIFFPKEIEYNFLILKTASHYVDAFLSVFMYEVGLKIIKLKSLPSKKISLFLTVTSIFVGFSSFSLILGVGKITIFSLYISILLGITRFTFNIFNYYLISKEKFICLIKDYIIGILIIFISLYIGIIMGLNAYTLFTIYILNCLIMSLILAYHAIKIIKKSNENKLFSKIIN